jgi:hypothetical protein
MIERFQYHASAVGASGHITLPFNEIIPVQASIALPESGGFGTARADRLKFHGILSFESAEAVVAGSYSPKDRSYDSVATVTITGLDILGMVTAGRVVARIASSHPADPEKEHSITPLGSYFDDLRIAGRPVELDLATDTFAKFDNARKVRAAYRDNEDGFHDEFDKLTLTGREDVPEGCWKYFPWLGERTSHAIEEEHGIVSCSLVREIHGLPRGLRPVGHVIPVPGFGIIRLAEFKMTGTDRRISMLEVDLGSTPSGKLSIGGAQGNGSDW